MLLKQADSKEQMVSALERLMATAPGDRKNRIEQELRTVRAGIKGEKEAAYLIDFHFKDRKSWVVIHDLRLVIDGRAAQIDHLLLNRFLECYVLETKHFSSGMKISEGGEFLRWNHYQKTYEGMPSPLAQNERHVAVLRDAFDRVEMPTRLGVRLGPSFFPFVLVSPNARVDRPRKFDTSKVIKADALRDAINARVEKEGVLDVFGGLARIVSAETLQEIGKQLVSLHSASTLDVTARFGLAELKAIETGDTETVDRPAPTPVASHQGRGENVCCRACGTEALAIEYGKYGYFFKCRDCGGNTPIKVGCGHSGHRERLRKEARRFYRECAECKSSSLYFVNPG